jgi:DNA repair protein RadC
MARVHPPELRRYGFSKRAVEKLSVAFELAKRYGEEEFVPGQPFRGSADVYAHFRERLGTELVEHFYLVLLDNKHRKLRDVKVSQGSLTSSVVHPRDVFLQVIRHSAAAVIFVHNHPSGDPTPSAEDLALTRRLRDVGELVGVRVLDHIIVGAGRYVSFVDDGYW